MRGRGSGARQARCRHHHVPRSPLPTAPVVHDPTHPTPSLRLLLTSVDTRPGTCFRISAPKLADSLSSSSAILSSADRRQVRRASIEASTIWCVRGCAAATARCVRVCARAVMRGRTGRRDGRVLLHVRHRVVDEVLVLRHAGLQGSSKGGPVARGEAVVDRAGGQEGRRSARLDSTCHTPPLRAHRVVDQRRVGGRILRVCRAGQRSAGGASVAGKRSRRLNLGPPRGGAHARKILICRPRGHAEAVWQT